MTSGFTVASASASFASLENSRSTMKALAAPWSSEKAMIGASSRVLSVLSTAPHMGTP